MKSRIILINLLFLFHFSYGQHITIYPEIIGGNFNYNMVLDQEMFYPSNAIESKAEGEIIVGFIVDKAGHGKDYEIIKSVHPELDESYISVLKHLLWEPGNIGGIESEIKMQKSEKFKVKKYQKLVKKRGYNEPTYAYQPIGSLFEIVSTKKLEQKAKPFFQDEKVNIYKFIREYIKIPDAAIKQGIKGEVEISFVVEVSGRLSNLKEIEGLGGGCTEEAFRLIQLLDWEPAKANGLYVRSEYKLKVNFGNTQY
jgi:hypothetical protein